MSDENPNNPLSSGTLSLIRDVLKIGGTFAATLGWIDPAILGSTVDTAVTAIGAVAALGGIIWSQIHHNRTVAIPKS